MERKSRPGRRGVMAKHPENQRGAILVLFALLSIVLIGFCALGIETGYWYLVKAELSKSVDAGAIAGAKNIANPYVDPLALAEQIAQENFPVGQLGTPTTGPGTVTFRAYRDDNHQIRVTGSVNPHIFLAQVFGINQIVASSRGVAQKNEVEIMLVLDRSGSMSGTPIRDLKSAAIEFIRNFEETQATDKLGLISFATSVSVNYALGHNYISPMTSAINNMTAIGATNAEDALAQAYGPQGLTDQSAIPADQRVQQFVIFFSDGNPTAFRGRFKNNGVDNIDAVVCGTGNTCDDVYTSLGRPDSETWLSINPNYTGDGKTRITSKCPTNSTTFTTKWYVFSQYPVPGYTDPEYCHIPNGTRQALPRYIYNTARQMTLDQADVLKGRNVKIYTIGLGNIDRTFLSRIASGSTYEYYTPNSSDLEAIFNAIAKDISLRLVM
jgi:Flp pilus assembly protein TadG